MMRETVRKRSEGRIPRMVSTAAACSGGTGRNGTAREGNMEWLGV